MNSVFYERHTYKNNALPIIFHDTVLPVGNSDISNFHWHENPELLFVTEGVLRVNLNGECIFAKNGEIVVVNSGVLHNMQAQNTTTKYFCLIIDADFCNLHTFNIEQTVFSNVIRHSEIFNYIYHIKNMLINQPSYYEEDIMSDIIKILISLFRNNVVADSQNTKQTKSVNAVKQGIYFIKQHYRDSISVEDISAAAGYSKYYFCHCFKELTGCTPNDYLTKYRLDYATKLLNSTDMTIGNIAAECGFYDISYFTKVFKKHNGISPSEARRQNPTE
jgi:YesN/AraC family two-component response regulator